MRRFSEREGLRKVRSKIQIDNVDKTLKNRLWSLVYIFFIKPMWEPSLFSSKWKPFLFQLWFDYFKEPTDTIPSDTFGVSEVLREYFFSCPWYEVYDFIEFIASKYPDNNKREDFIESCNKVLEEELSGYRFVGGMITRITSETEIAEIEEALVSPFGAVNKHLEEALKLMSDRKSPDYRNSIKESISAVEAICKIISKDDKATLGRVLDKVDEMIGLHQALKRALDSLYGYTSTAEGIRHALLDEKVRLDFEDAKFMLVLCSAFVNYLLSKAYKAKIL